MPDSKLHSWFTPGTVTSLVSTILIVGSFVGVTNYRASRQDKDWDEFRSAIHAQISELKRTTDERIDKIDKRLDNMSSDNLNNIRLQARFESLEKELSRVSQENSTLSQIQQARWDSLTTRLAKAGF